MTDLLLRCRCGHVRAHAVDVSPSTTNCVVCYCHDCRAFARWLGRDDLLDAGGGTRVVQMARGRVAFDAGLDAVQCMRLSDKGMFRWYASCCRTPVGNTLPVAPFLGVISGFFDPDAADRWTREVPLLVRVHTGSACGPVPAGGAPALPMFLRVTRLLLGWTVRGLGGDTLFDRKTRKPRVEPRVLTRSERDALRDGAVRPAADHARA
jgi:hypothetical protein